MDNESETAPPDKKVELKEGQYLRTETRMTRSITGVPVDTSGRIHVQVNKCTYDSRSHGKAIILNLRCIAKRSPCIAHYKCIYRLSYIYHL